jgi:transcriptional regulator
MPKKKTDLDLVREIALALPDTTVERLIRQIVGFRIEINRLEGKWKLNQNHPQERRDKVAVALQKRSDDNSQEIAAMMTAR